MYSIDLHGVQSVSPRGVDGVKSEASRGEISDAHGVKPISPNSSIEPSNRTSLVGIGGFDEFWHVYPRKEAKKAAVAAWGRAIRSASPDVIVAGALRYAMDPNREPEFTAHPATWLNQGRWDDEPLPAKGGKASGTKTFLEASTALASGALLELEAANDPF